MDMVGGISQLLLSLWQEEEELSAYIHHTCQILCKLS